jgi:hypothetical protein
MKRNSTVLLKKHQIVLFFILIENTVLLYQKLFFVYRQKGIPTHFAFHRPITLPEL